MLKNNGEGRGYNEHLRTRFKKMSIHTLSEKYTSQCQRDGLIGRYNGSLQTSSHSHHITHTHRTKQHTSSHTYTSTINEGGGERGGGDGESGSKFSFFQYIDI